MMWDPGAASWSRMLSTRCLRISENMSRDGLLGQHPLFADHPLCVPKISGLAGELTEWIESVSFERLRIPRSRRADNCGPPAKKALPKELRRGDQGYHKLTGGAVGLPLVNAQMKFLSQHYVCSRLERLQMVQWFQRPPRLWVEFTRIQIYV